MATINENFLKLKAGYLFPEIGRRVRGFVAAHPEAKMIRMGIGDVTQPVARVVVSQRVPEGMAIMYHAQEKNVNVPGSNTTGKRGGILNSVTKIIMKPTNLIGGYAQLSYAFNYYGAVGSQRDENVIIHKIEDADVDWLERDLTPEREAQLNPPGVNN